MKRPCEERDRLIAEKDAAFSKWYEVRNRYERLVAEMAGNLVDEVPSAAQNAEQKVHHLQRALTAHYGKHRCNTE